VSVADFCQRHKTFRDPEREVCVVESIPQASRTEIQALPTGLLGGTVLLTPTTS